MAETVPFWIEIDHFSIWSLQFPNFAYKPLIFSISNFKPLKIRLKGKWVKFWVITVALYLQCLRCKGIGKFIFFWLCIVSSVKKNKREKRSLFSSFSLIDFFSGFFFFFFKKNGLIVSGDLPDRKKKREGFREWSHFSRRPARCRIKRKKSFVSGLIVPSNLPDRKKKRERFREWSHFSRRPAR
jgi:hypothetical protein